MSFIRVGLRGTLPGGEVWSVNPAFNESTDVVDWDQAAGQQAANAIGAITVPAALKSLLSSSAQMASVRVERRSDSNRLIGAAEAGWAGGGQSGAAASKTFQTSTVISLRSNVPGARGRGRLYWPALGAVLTAGTLRLGNPTPAAVATASVEYLDAIETALKNAIHPSPSLIDFHLAVYSPTTQTKTDITRIEVGDILDTQRRRRDTVQETYASAVYP